MESARVLIAMSGELSNSKVRSLLTENGYNVVDQAVDGYDCLRKLSTIKPDLLIVDFSLPSLGGYDVAKVAIEDRLCDVILVASETQLSFVNDIKNEFGLIFLSKPLNKSLLLNSIELMFKSKVRVKQLEKEIASLKDTIDTRKEVEKAKGLLMKHLNLSEAEAFKRIQKKSMDSGKPMKDIAKAIILAYDI